MSNAKKNVAPKQQPATKAMSAAERKRYEDSLKVKDLDAQLSVWAFRLLKLILTACLARIVKAELLTAEAAKAISLDARDGRAAWQVLVNPKVASKAKADRFTAEEARALGKVEFGLAVAESKDPRLSGMVSAYKLHEAAWLIIRAHVAPESGDPDQAHLNAMRVAMLARDEQAEGKEAKALATINREKELRKVLRAAVAKAGANPLADTVKKTRVQSGKETITINTDSKDFGSLTFRSLKPERAAAIRATAPEFMLGIDHVEDLADALKLDPKALRAAMVEAGALSLSFKAEEKKEKKERKPSASTIIRERLDKRDQELLDLIV